MFRRTIRFATWLRAAGLGGHRACNGNPDLAGIERGKGFPAVDRLVGIDPELGKRSSWACGWSI